MTDHIKVPIIPAKTDGTPKNDGLSYCSHGAGWSGEILGVPIVPSGHGSCIKAGIMPVGPGPCSWNDDFSGGMGKWNNVAGFTIDSERLHQPEGTYAYAQLGATVSGDFDVRIWTDIYPNTWYGNEYIDWYFGVGNVAINAYWGGTGEWLYFGDGSLNFPEGGMPYPMYLRIVRTGSVAEGYYSTDGNSWVIIGASSQATGTDLHIESYDYFGSSPGQYWDDLHWEAGCPA